MGVVSYLFAWVGCAELPGGAAVAEQKLRRGSTSRGALVGDLEARSAERRGPWDRVRRDMHRTTWSSEVGIRR